MFVLSLLNTIKISLSFLSLWNQSESVNLCKKVLDTSKDSLSPREKENKIDKEVKNRIEVRHP
ncbi:hypothetical protein ACGTN9_20435 [Halobacillus sp. MO56]